MAGRRPGGARARPAAAVAGGIAQAARLLLGGEPPLWPGWRVPAAVRSTRPADGTLAWQIILIAASAALFATALAVTAYRIRAARRRETTTAA